MIFDNEDIPIEIVRCKDCEHWKLNHYDDVETCFEHRNVDGTEQATKPDDFCSWGREERMTLNEFVEELDIAIKQDGHDIYCDAETAEMLKSLINDVEKPKRLHKICTIYAIPPNDTKKVDELLKTRTSMSQQATTIIASLDMKFLKKIH